LSKRLKKFHGTLFNLEAKTETVRKGNGALVRRSILDRIFEEMQNLRYRLDDIERMLSNWQPQPIHIPESTLFSLADHLRKTYLTVASKGECNATEVSNVTGRSRAMESSYLNQLTRMGWLTKRRESRSINFRPISEDAFIKQLRQEISTTP